MADWITDIFFLEKDETFAIFLKVGKDIRLRLIEIEFK